MKKQLSLFMSAALIFTLIFSLAASASSIQIKPATLLIDTQSAQTAEFSYSNGNTTLLLDGKSTGFGVKSTAPALQGVVAEFGGYTNVMTVKKSSSKTPYLNMTFRDASGGTIKDGRLEVKTKLMITGALDESKRYFRIIHTGGSSGGTAKKIDSGFIPNVWYDTEWVVDMDSASQNVKLTFTPELSAESSAEVENYTISYLYSYAQADISYLRIDLLPASTSDYVYLADMVANHYPNTIYNKAEILSIGSDGEVMYNQNNISVKLSEDIPNITARDISIKDRDDNEVEVDSVSITSDGSAYIMDVTTVAPLASQADYTFTILAKAWGASSTQVEDGTETAVTDISIDFHTPKAPVQIKPATVHANMGDAQTVTLSYDNGNSSILLDGTRLGQVSSTATGLQSIIETYEGYNNVMKVSKSSSKTPYISITPRNSQGTNIKEGKFIYKAKLRSDNAIDSSKRVFRIINTGGSSEGVTASLYKDSDAVTWMTDVWYDVEWTVDMDRSSANASLVLTPEIPGATAEEIASKTIKHTYSYAKDDISYIRIDLLPASTSGGIYWANIALLTSSDESYYNKAEIVSVGDDGEVMFGQREIQFTLSEEIPGLSERYISVKDADGNVIDIASAAIADNGDGYDVTLTTSEPLSGWTNYNLAILSGAWGLGSVQLDTAGVGVVTDVTVPFHTPSAPLDIKTPAFTVEGDSLCVDTALINTTNSPVDITLSIVVYGADGRVKSVNPLSYSGFTSGDDGEEVHLEAPFAEGDTAKIMAINGWEKMTALFGKHWVVSYDELER